MSILCLVCALRDTQPLNTRKNVAEVASNHCCLFFSRVECMAMQDKDCFPASLAVRSAMWLCSRPWVATLRFCVQGCYLAFMCWPRSTQVNSWQNGSHVFGMAEQQDRESLGLRGYGGQQQSWHMYDETIMWKKETSISWSPCYYGLCPGSQTNQPTDPERISVDQALS